MKWYEIIGLIGSVVSIGSAIFAFIQAKIAKAEKKEAVKVKEEIITRYANYNDSQLRSKIEGVLRQLNAARGKKIISTQNKIGKDEYSYVTDLLIQIRGQKIFENENVYQNVVDCEEITKMNSFDYNSISELIVKLADIQRYIDKTIRG